MKHLLIAMVIVGLAPHGAEICRAEERESNDPAQMTRDEWQSRLRESRERARLMRQEARTFVPYQNPTLDELAEEASRRVLEDESLLPGDIVSTNRGLFKFQGNPNKERKVDDFVRIR